MIEVLAAIDAAPTVIPAESGIKLCRDRPYRSGQKVELFTPTREADGKSPSMQVASHWFGHRSAGQVHAEALVAAEASLPMEWRPHPILCLGTEWRKSGKEPVVLFPYLFYAGLGWNVGFVHDIHRCHSHFRLLYLRG